jgi:hypothetical protein
MPNRHFKAKLIHLVSQTGSQVAKRSSQNIVIKSIGNHTYRGIGAINAPTVNVNWRITELS